MMSKARFLVALLAVFAFAVVTVGTAGAGMVFKTKNDVAIKGYDPVAYFSEGKPVKGKADYSYEWNGAAWHFASSDNMMKFKENPEKYAPQYGGYCAWGLAEKNELYPIDPKAWNIEDGKLYLNYNGSIRGEWRKDIPGFVAKADTNWAKMSGSWNAKKKGMKMKEEAHKKMRHEKQKMHKMKERTTKKGY